MTREAKKAAYEREVFEKFLDLTGLEISRNSIVNGNATQSEPDLLCEYTNGEKVGFELGRLIDPNLAQAVNRWEPKNGEYIRTSDPSGTIAQRKIKKIYTVSFPVELLLYKEYPIITPDNVIIPTIQPVCHMKHKYHRVWFMGNSVVRLYERS